MEKHLADVKLIALDMDGTLLNDHHEVSEENKSAIKEAEAKGATVVLSTGRSLNTCRDYAVSLELSSYLVTVNGSEIWGPSGELVERNQVSTDHMQWMWDLSKEHKTGFWAISTDGTWHDEMPEDFHGKQWLKFGFNIEDDLIREKIMNDLSARQAFEISNSSPVNIEVNAIGINKAKGLRNVCELLGISMDNVMAVGDSLNDMAMIKEAGLGIAMGNAQPAVKEAADWVTGTNNESGVAQAIRKWVL
ncbi:Cof-type HAD-IIB family hydrolase [Bacillus sp. T33-2]|uniref:Cof-type HAD-IIB family hydrolase n=1 Tax=Bacillus sp. T33-2 TaxID=2054168 RepID=UPI000C756E9B|nr:Cof-type HAD-IIB family hydrolase [Bacillus sp. T33-2]PLR95079.1 phosphoglycolate phosphatase [Bacillus sp. T33-2]